MPLRSLLIMLLISIIPNLPANAQERDFCASVQAIIDDAPATFNHLKGKQVSANETGIAWDTKAVVPGVIKGRFMYAMGLFYEGALFQTKDKTALKVQYDKYKSMLDDCFISHGYTLSKSDNFYTGMEACKKLMYMKATDDTATAAPPHITLEADYRKETGAYTLILYVWEH